MSFSGEKADALRLIEGVEDGKLDSGEAYQLAQKMDPLLFYFVVRYLREAFSGNQQAHEAIAMRVAQLFSTYPDLTRAIKSGEKDVMREWFDDSHNMREFSHRAEEYIELIYDKLES